MFIEYLLFLQQVTFTDLMFAVCFPIILSLELKNKVVCKLTLM